MIRWFRFVPFDRVASYLLCGWTVADPDMHSPHGDFAVLMVWLGDNPLEPLSS